MQRRKFVKYTGLAGLAAGLFPIQSIQGMSPNPATHLMKFSTASTQIRHGALNMPFAAGLQDEFPFQWVLDVHQNIFLKDGFQRNLEGDMNVISVALKEGEHFEALQINKQADQISFLWKEQWLDCAKGLPLHQLDLQDENYTFCLGYMTKEETLVLEQEPGVDYFVQVIEGQVQNEDNLLDTESGLGIVSNIQEEQRFLAQVDSSLLIIGRCK